MRISSKNIFLFEIISLIGNVTSADSWDIVQISRIFFHKIVTHIFHFKRKLHLSRPAGAQASIDRKPWSGLNQLLWYYADLEKKRCLEDMSSRRDTLEGLMHGRRSNKVRM